MKLLQADLCGVFAQQSGLTVAGYVAPLAARIPILMFRCLFECALRPPSMTQKN
jgi:hypothetical protein